MDNNMNPFAPQPSTRPDNANPAPEAPGQNNNNQPPAENPMNNPAETAAPQLDPQLPPAMSNQPFQQGQTASLNNQGGPKLNNTGVALESPILEPSHFDGMQDPNLQFPQNGMNGMNGQFPNAAAAQQQTPEQKAKMFMTLSIVFGALAFIGIILGIWSLVSNINTSGKLANAQADLVNKNAIIAKVEQDTGTSIRTPDDVPAYTPVTGYIYITEWGIKFKIPEDLENVSYILDQKYRPQICFNAHKTGIKYFPAFADVDQNPGGLGCVTRVASYEGDSDKDTGISFGQPIYSYGDYNYYYNAPEGHFSQDAAEQGLEDTAVQIIKNMVSQNISHYE